MDTPFGGRNGDEDLAKDESFHENITNEQQRNLLDGIDLKMNLLQPKILESSGSDPVKVYFLRYLNATKICFCIKFKI